MNEVVAHSIRNGSARDLAHLGTNMNGVASVDVSKVLAYIGTTMSGGVTDSYVGPINEDVALLKSKLQYHDRNEGRFATPFKPSRRGPRVIDEWCDAHGLAKDIRKNRQQASIRL